MKQLSDTTEALAELNIDKAVEPAITTSSYPKVITLEIGGRKYRTSVDTLRFESGLFHRQLSDSYTWNPEADGSYFLDADPDLFEHLLRFMRRPEVFPLFYDAAKGFDYDLYNKLEAEAEYFQINALHEWIKENNYLKAVVQNTSSAQVRDLDSTYPRRDPVNESAETHMIPRTRKVYICPRGIQFHRGDRRKCGAACMKAQLGSEDDFEEEMYVEVASVRREIVFVASVCRIGRGLDRPS